MLVFGVVLGAAAYVLVSRIAYSSVEEVVNTRMHEVRDQLASTESGAFDLEAIEVSSPVAVQVVSATGAVIASTPGLRADQDLCSRPDGYLTRIEPSRTANGRVTTCASASLRPVENVQKGVLIVLLIVLPLVLLAVGVAVWLAVGRALGSVEHLREQAEQMTSVDDGVLTVQPTGDEVEQLGRTLNDLIDRLHAQSKATRQFVADAGHELRNPLATLRVALEFDVDEGDAATHALALAELGRLEALVQDLLVLARTDAHETPAAERVDLADVVEASVEAQRAVHPDLAFVPSMMPATVWGDPRALRSAVDNLVANAARHAAAVVRVRITTTGDACALTVDDDGAGLRPEDCDRVFDRFVRLDDARDRDEGGSGLGLAIVAAIAHAHGGAVNAAPGPGGHFTLVLPMGRPA
jgi:signal transduction histidine kinase